MFSRELRELTEFICDDEQEDILRRYKEYKGDHAFLYLFKTFQAPNFWSGNFQGCNFVHVQMDRRPKNKRYYENKHEHFVLYPLYIRIISIGYGIQTFGRFAIVMDGQV